jgi:hypothetical protein
MSRPAVVLSFLVLGLACTACGGGPSSAPEEGRPATTSSDDNQIRLSAAESSRLVAWAETFHSCMLGKGVALGHLEKSEKQIRMTLPPSVDVQKLLVDTESCGDAPGWPAP